MQTDSKKQENPTDANNVLVDFKYFLEAFKIPKERFGKKESHIKGVESLKILNYGK
jgi:hypothetical protein